jgi:hypothetical protein
LFSYETMGAIFFVPEPLPREQKAASVPEWFLLLF